LNPEIFTFPITTVGFVVSAFKDVSELEILYETARCVVSEALQKQVTPVPAVIIIVSNSSLYKLCITGVFEFTDTK
jgi:hypothetical protein